ncbi:myb-like protein I isoform X2 [Chironomus tepperi]|uniref:myb-like protein I isoform X2 n=1 Tax=Chironomus tepperi TaxID=113505 RepID=UPI00391F5B6B
MSTIEGVSMDESKKMDGENLEDETSNDIPQQRTGPPVHIIRYSTATLFALRSSKLSQQRPACKNMDLACMIHMKPPPKMLIANMMPKFALNQMPNRGEESISPLSFHSNSSSSSNLSYQKRYQDGKYDNNSGNDGYNTSNRYYYNKYKNNDDGSSSRIIYKTTGANASNGNSIRFLKKAYNNKYEQENSLGLISNKNILDNSSRVITAADHRNSRKKVEEDVKNEIKSSKSNDISHNEDSEKKMPSDEANNNSENDKNDNKKLTEVNANDLMLRNDLKKLPNDLDITNHLDDIFNDLNINQLLDDNNMPDERESSRFSKWFTVNKDETKDEQIPDTQNNNSNNIINNKHVNLSMFTHETDKFFQPIDKVESNSIFNMMKAHEMENQRNDLLMNMLKHQQPTVTSSSSSSALSPNSGQVHSVEELEAKLRHHNEDKDRKSNENEKKVLQNFFQQQLIPNLMPQQRQHQPLNHHQQNQDDINAFKKLLSQITNENDKISNPIVSAPSNQNMLQQLINKGFQNNPDVMNQYQKSFPMAGKVPPVNSQKLINPINSGMMQQQFSGNVDLKFLQQQPPQPQQKIPLPEIMKRPEVQALVQELTSGELSQYTLWQRLTAPGLTPIERDIITCALNVFNTNSNNGNSGMFPKQTIGPNPNLYSQSGPIPTNQNASQLHQLMQHQMKASTLTAPIPIPPQTSPLSPVPPIEPHLLFQHQAAVAANKQLRLSPLPASGFSMGPAVLPSNNLTLHVPGMPQRIPSPRELQYHTQSIMQNALIRKKLEEQRENFRKRQEQEKQEIAKKSQHEISPSSSVDASNDQQNSVITTIAPSQQEESLKNPNDSSPNKKMISVINQSQIQRQHAPSPSIFTPTSVLRKMTAEKESDSGKSTSNVACIDDKKKQVTNMQQQHSIRNQMPQPFMNNMAQVDRMKIQNEAFGWESQQMGGINKPPAQQTAAGNQQNNMNQAGQVMSSNSINFDFQQQQQQQQQMQKLNQIQKAQFLQQQQQQQMMQMKKQQMDNNPVLSQFMAQQQQRAQAQSQFRSQYQQQQQQQQPMNFQSMIQGRSDKNEDLLDNRNILNNGGCLSPTSNQLAKWFSPELLADASAGKLLPSLNVGQMMSLEELEKCMQNS